MSRRAAKVALKAETNVELSNEAAEDAVKPGFFSAGGGDCGTAVVSAGWAAYIPVHA